MKEILYQALASWGQSWDQDQVSRNGERLGRLLWRLLPDRRKLAIEGISYHLGYSPDEAEKIAQQSFCHNGRSFLELFLSRRIDKRFIDHNLTIADPKSFEALLAMDRPCVAISGHFGAWELVPSIFHLLLPERHKQLVVRRPKDQALHDMTTRLRSKTDVEIVDHRSAVLKVLRCLKKGGTTGFLVDHNSSTSEAVFLPFLKKIAAVNMGPALLAIRAGALIQPLYLVRESDGKYTLHTEKYLDTATLEGSREERIQQAALFYTRSVEAMVKKHPEQWYWLHKRWKTQPPEGWTYTPPKPRASLQV